MNKYTDSEICLLSFLQVFNAFVEGLRKGEVFGMKGKQIEDAFSRMVKDNLITDNPMEARDGGGWTFRPEKARIMKRGADLLITDDAAGDIPQ